MPEVESVNVTAELAPWLDGEGEELPTVFLIAAEPQKSSLLLEHFAVDVVPGSTTSKTLKVLQAVRNALAHEARFRDIAGRAELDPETILDVLAAELARGPMSQSETAAFSAADRAAFEAANVDLSGPVGATRPALSTASAYLRLLAEALSVEECARLLGVSAGRVRQRIGPERSLYAVRSRLGNEWRLPSWQFDAEGVVPRLEVVLPQIPVSMHALAVEQFMTTPSSDLVLTADPLSPVQWLVLGGDPAAVADLAAGLPALP